MKDTILHLRANDFFSDGFPFGVIRVRTDNVSPLWHDHDFFEMVFIVNGSGVHKTLSRKTPLKRGSVYFLNRGEAHSYETKGMLENITFVFSPAFIRDPYISDIADDLSIFPLKAFAEGRRGGFHALSLTLAAFAAVHPLIESIASEHAARREHYQRVIRCDMTKLLIMLSRSDDTPAPMDTHAERAMEYIRTHYRGDVTLTAIADAAGLNSSYLSRHFHARTGFRITEYINDVRTQKATELLRTTRMPVIDIAEETGYKSLSAFYDAFKRATGVSPAQVREHANAAGKKPGTKGKKTGRR
ncbi:MAG: AraC family transcriptional regulator [Spirochaetota bacterium]|mgnify:CR=1 FL=1